MWRLLPLAVGLTALTGQVVAGFVRPSGEPAFVHFDLVLLIAVVVTGVGLLLAINPMTRAVGQLAHRSGHSLAVRIGGARAAFDPAATARLVAGLAILVFAVGVTIGQSRDARAVSVPTGPYADVMVVADELPSGATIVALLENAPVPAIVEVSTDPDSPRDTDASVAGCDQLTRFLGSDAALSDFTENCEPATAYWAPEIPHADRTLEGLPLPGAEIGSGEMPAPIADSLPGSDVLLTLPAAAVTSADPPNATSDDGSTVFTELNQVVLRAPLASVNATLAYVYSIAPYSQPSVLGLDPDSGLDIAMINGYIRLGLLGGALMALLALAAALADRTTERRRADHELLAGGAPRSLVQRAHRWEVALILGAALSVASIAGSLGGMAWQLAGGLIRTPDWVSIAALIVASAGVGVAATLAAAAAAPRRLELSALRSA